MRRLILLAIVLIGLATGCDLGFNKKGGDQTGSGTIECTQVAVSMS